MILQNLLPLFGDDIFLHTALGFVGNGADNQFLFKQTVEVVALEGFPVFYPCDFLKVSAFLGLSTGG